MSTETEIPARIKTTWLIGVVAAFSIFAVIAWYSGHMTRAYPSYDQKRAADRYETLAKVQAAENLTLTGTADWIDQNKKIIHIPIDEAMAKEIDTLKAQPAQVGSALPVIPPPATPAAAPAKTDAAASTNAAPAPAPAAPAPPKK
jgi:hypothetical protein